MLRSTQHPLDSHNGRERFVFRLVAMTVVVAALLVGGGASAAFATTRTSTSGALKDSRLDPAVVTQLDRKGAVDAFVTMPADSNTGKGATAHSQLKSRLHSRKRALVDDSGVQTVREYSELPVSLVRVQNKHQLVRLLANPSVTGIFLPHTGTLADTSFGTGTQSDATALNLIRQPTVAASGYQGNGTYVAVIDTGADYSQPAFGSCSAPNVPTTCHINLEHDYAADDGYADDDGHGTNTAGVIANVAPATKILALDVFHVGPSGEQTYDEPTLLTALNDVAAWKRSGFNIAAASMSLGMRPTYFTSSCATIFSSVFSDLTSMGVVPVVAAGNDGIDGNGDYKNGIGTPSCDSSALSVGAVEDSTGDLNEFCDTWTVTDSPACFSQTGPNLGLWAPGVHINAAGVEESGTSQATPHVAGAVAVLAAARPTANTAQLKQALTTSGPFVVDSRFPENAQKRRLDLVAAINTLFGMNTPPAVSVPAERPVLTSIGSTSASYSISWTATDGNGIARTQRVVPGQRRRLAAGDLFAGQRHVVHAEGGVRCEVPGRGAGAGRRRQLEQPRVRASVHADAEAGERHWPQLHRKLVLILVDVGLGRAVLLDVAEERVGLAHGDRNRPGLDREPGGEPRQRAGVRRRRPPEHRQHQLHLDARSVGCFHHALPVLGDAHRQDRQHGDLRSPDDRRRRLHRHAVTTAAEQ